MTNLVALPYRLRNGLIAGKRISLAEAKTKFPAIVDGVLHHDEHYLIERHGRPVAALVSVAELEWLEQARPPAEHPAGAMALVGRWHDVPDEEIDAMRNRDTGPPVELEA